jgi:hypothetical protein
MVFHRIPGCKQHQGGSRLPLGNKHYKNMMIITMNPLSVPVDPKHETAAQEQ